MADYRRYWRAGGTYFFTAVTEGRAPILLTPLGRKCLRQALIACRASRPFDLLAVVLLPDHLHTLWALPPGDDDFAGRWAALKAGFTCAWIAGGGGEGPRSASRVRSRRRGVWQRRYFEHLVRDADDFEAHLHYIHYNPVKHGLARCPHAWPYSSFGKWVRCGAYDERWQCTCGVAAAAPPDFRRFDGRGME